jgi:predicted xylose isomerase-like sugar epimerase
MPNLDLTLLLGRDWLCHISKAYEAAERTINAVSGHRKFRYVRSRMHHYFQSWNSKDQHSFSNHRSGFVNDFEL